MWRFFKKVENFSPGPGGHCKEPQCKDARLRSCWPSLPQGSFHDLLHREPMLRMQEGEGHSQLCLDRLQLEAIHKVKALFHLFTHLHTHFLPTLDLNIKDMGDEKVQREGRIQLWQPHLPECDRPTPSYLSHSIMVLSFQIVTPSLHTHTAPPAPFTARTHPKAPAANSSLVCSSFPRSASAQTWTPMDGWYLEDSPVWFGSILSVHSPHHWATVCSLKVEPTSVLCSSRPPRLKGLASLQPATAFCPVPSRGPHRAFGMKSARNTRPPHAQSHRNWGLHE